MPETRSTNAKRDTAKTNNKTEAGAGAAKKPKKAYVDPLRHKNYQDPLRQEIIRYEGNFKIPEYKPYTSYHEYQVPDIDPLTGRPRRKRAVRPKPEPVVHEPEVKKPPAKGPELHPYRFPPEFGNSVGSVKRSIDIMSNMDF